MGKQMKQHISSTFLSSSAMDCCLKGQVPYKSNILTLNIREPIKTQQWADLIDPGFCYCIIISLHLCEYRFSL